MPALSGSCLCMLASLPTWYTICAPSDGTDTRVISGLTVPNEGHWSSHSRQIRVSRPQFRAPACAWEAEPYRGVKSSIESNDRVQEVRDQIPDRRPTDL